LENEFINTLYDNWNNFLGVLPRLILSVLILLITLFIAVKTSRIVRKRLERRLSDMLLANFLGRITKWAVTFVGVFICMDILGLSHFASGLMAGAGVSAIILGFAFKDIGENFLAGVILAFNRPFKVGDVIESENITGSILSMDLRTTTIKTFEGIDVFVPNSKILNNPLINYNREDTRRFDFNIGIDYDSNVTEAKTLILKELSGISDILRDPPPLIVVKELSSNSINLRIFFWVNTVHVKRGLLEVKGEAIERSLNSLKEGDVNIPFDSVQVQFNKGIPEIPVTITNRDAI
jgi:small-conductance mechanosensitive channel